MPGMPICTALFCVVLPVVSLGLPAAPRLRAQCGVFLLCLCVLRLCFCGLWLLCLCDCCWFMWFMLLFVFIKFMLKVSSLEVRSLTSEFVLNVFQVEVSKVERSRSVIGKFDFWTSILCLILFQVWGVASRFFWGGMLHYRTNIPERS